MSLQKKILTGYTLAVILMGIVVAWAMGHIVAINRTSDAIIHENHKSILTAENMIDSLERQDSAVLMTLFGSKEKGLKKFRKNEMDFLKWLTRAKDNVQSSEETGLLTSIESEYSDYIQKFTHIIELNNHADQPPKAKMRIYQDSLAPIADGVREKCVKLSSVNEEIMYENNSDTNRLAARAVWSTTAAAIIGIIAVLIFSFILSQRITKPLRRLMDATKQIADGEYTVSVPVESNDEFGKLAEEFNRMAAKLNEYQKLNAGRIFAEKQKGDAILKNIADGLIVFDHSLMVTDINPAACEILGRSTQGCLNRSYKEIIKNEKICEQLCMVSEIGQAPQTEEEDNIFEIGNSDKKKHFSCSITAITDAAGAISGIVMMLKDVTWFKEIEKLKTEFVMSASHELRTPLASMGMSLQLLADNTSDKLKPRELELLQGANDELKRLKSMVNDLLDLSKIESGRIEMEMDSISPFWPIEKVKTSLQVQIENKGIKFEIDVPEELPNVRADADKITWVLTNLVSNSLRYVEQGQGRIIIQARPAGKFVHISITDNGPGIPEEYQTKVFQKFTRIEGDETGGTGLGLAICKEIIRAHGGTIWVESEQGIGSTFTFTLSAVK